jgi:acylphosphatase
MPTIHLVISGKVQGVFYRATAKELAERLKLDGWIKNTKEGNVEILASGPSQDLLKFTEWCKIGPEDAVVSNVEVTDSSEKPEQGFKIVRF